MSAYIGVYLNEDIREEALSRKLRTFSRFMEIAVSFDSRPRITNGVEVYPTVDFLEKLWANQIV